MGGIKRTQADKYFSNCVRERAGWHCEKCKKYFPEGLSRKGLDCSHHHSRGNWGTRFDPMGAESLCYGCHSHYGGTEERRKEVMTEAQQQILLERKNDINLGKLYRKTKGKGEISAHFRGEWARMRALREAGITGRIEFEAFY